MSQSDFAVWFQPDGYGPPRAGANPRHPNGRHVDLRLDAAAESCSLELPYPVAESGVIRITCERCGWSGNVLVEGRRDDPRFASIGCKPRPQRKEPEDCSPGSGLLGSPTVLTQG